MPRNNVFTRDFWYEYRRDLRRLRRDPRARMRVGVRSFALAYNVLVLGVVTWVVYRMHDTGTNVILGLMAGVVVVVLVARRVSHWRDEREQRALDFGSTPQATADRLMWLAHGLAAVVHRALSELWLQTNDVPEGAEVQTRRLLLEPLRGTEAWDEMPGEARLWMMRPDREWPPQVIAAVLSEAETLHVLAWVVCVEPELRAPDLFAQPLGFDRLTEKLREPARALRPPWDLRVERNRVVQYFLRCHAEAVHRGLVVSDGDEQRQQAEQWRADIVEGAAEDDFAGFATIAEVDDGTLLSILKLAALRLQTLGLVLEIFDGDEAAWGRLRSLVFQALEQKANSLRFA